LWGLPAEREYLTAFPVAVLWAREHGVITAADARRLRVEPAAEQRAALAQLRGLRAALFRAVTAGRLDGVHPYVARAVARSAYAPSGKLTAQYGTRMIVDRCALAAHELLSDYGPAAVGLCASEACGWVFLDPSHRRRWCTMAVCGNRAKVRRFAARRRAG
jgi:predicted RNA-binding Zn ribbon-like protein